MKRPVIEFCIMANNLGSDDHPGGFEYPYRSDNFELTRFKYFNLPFDNRLLQNIKGVLFIFCRKEGFFYCAKCWTNYDKYDRLVTNRYLLYLPDKIYCPTSIIKVFRKLEEPIQFHNKKYVKANEIIEWDNIDCCIKSDWQIFCNYSVENEIYDKLINTSLKLYNDTSLYILISDSKAENVDLITFGNYIYTGNSYDLKQVLSRIEYGIDSIKIMPNGKQPDFELENIVFSYNNYIDGKLKFLMPKERIQEDILYIKRISFLVNLFYCEMEKTQNDLKINIFRDLYIVLIKYHMYKIDRIILKHDGKFKFKEVVELYLVKNKFNVELLEEFVEHLYRISKKDSLVRNFLKKFTFAIFSYFVDIKLLK